MRTFRMIVLAAAIVGSTAVAGRAEDDAAIHGTLQSLDSAQIVVDGKRYLLASPAVFQRGQSGVAIDPIRIKPGTLVYIELDPSGHVVLVRAMLPG